MATERPPREALSDLLQIERQGPGLYRTVPESFWGGYACGDLLAKMALAVGREANATPTSLHASFTGRAIADEAVSIRCASALGAQRAASMEQSGAVLCEAIFRFDPRAGALAYQSPAHLEDIVAPEALPSEAETGAQEGWAMYAVGPVETRRVSRHGTLAPNEEPEWTGWLKPRAPIPTDPIARAAALVFLGEYRSHWAAERRLGDAFFSTELTLNDFALWIHAPMPWDDYFLVRTRSDVANEGRIFSRREILTRRGVLVASAAWHLSARPASGPPCPTSVSISLRSSHCLLSVLG